MRREGLEVGGLVKSGVLQVTWLVFVIVCDYLFAASMYLLLHTYHIYALFRWHSNPMP